MPAHKKPQTEPDIAPGKHADGSRAPAEFREYRQGMAALALRLAGASFTEVAEALGLGSVADAYEMVESTLARRVTERDRDLLRDLEAARLDRLQRSVWATATDHEHPDHFIALNAALKISESRRRLLGLDAPTEITVHTPTQDELERWVAQVSHQQVDKYAALEASVIDVPELPAAVGE